MTAMLDNPCRCDLSERGRAPKNGPLEKRGAQRPSPVLPGCTCLGQGESCGCALSRWEEELLRALDAAGLEDDTHASSWCEAKAIEDGWFGPGRRTTARALARRLVAAYLAAGRPAEAAA